MIMWLAIRAGVRPEAIKAMLGLAGALLLVVGILWYGEHREREGIAKTDAKWAAASARVQAATIKATNAANALARAREAQNAATIEDLRNEAAKGDDRAVGPGVLAVIERMRAQEGRGGGQAPR